MTVFLMFMLVANGSDLKVGAEIFESAEMCLKSSIATREELTKTNEQVKVFCEPKEIIKSK